jgi:hypothetical protein
MRTSEWYFTRTSANFALLFSLSFLSLQQFPTAANPTPIRRAFYEAAVHPWPLLFGGVFLYNGINHFLQYKTLSQYAQAKGVPFPPVTVLSTGALLTAGGASLLLGLRPKWGAAAVTNSYLCLCFLNPGSSFTPFQEFTYS